MLEHAPAPDESERIENDVSLAPVLDGGRISAVRQPGANFGHHDEQSDPMRLSGLRT